MNEKEITDNIRLRLGIAELNQMQTVMAATGPKGTVMLLAPTGSGKTVAFTIPLLKSIGKPCGKVQAVVMAPSRELVLQIADVIRPVAAGYKTTALYGGHPMQEEVNSLSVTPDIIVATPGRLLDHLKRGQIDLSAVTALVLDEYDKSLELGFADEMRRIVKRLTAMRFLIVTSATRLAENPDWLPLQSPLVVDFRQASEAPRDRMQVVRVESPVRDKIQTLADLLESLPDGRAIVFANHRESAERIFSAMRADGLPVGLYHGGLEQKDRENAIEMLNNGTTPILISTDLGSRGLDISGGVDAVVHYHLPLSAEAWTHRNGRTARVDASGTVFVITAEGENIPDYVEWDRDYYPSGKNTNPIKPTAATLYFNVGKKEKISRGDIVGYLIAKGGLDAGEIGRISLRDHCALVAVPPAKAREVTAALASQKIKNTRVKVTILQP